MCKPASKLFLGCLLLCVITPGYSENLSDIYHAAQTSDPTLASAEADFQAQLLNKPIARSALLPQINASAGYDQIDIEYNDTTAIPYSDDTFSRESWGLQLSQALYRKDHWARLAQADAGVAQAQADIESARQALIVRSAEAYFDVLTAQDSLVFAQAEKDAVQQQYEQSQERFDVGLIAITDVRESKAQLDISIASEIAAQAQLDTARENLAAIIGYQPKELVPLAETLPLAEPAPSDIDAWVDTAMDNNLQIRAASYGVEAAKQGVELSRAGHYPTLDLVGQYSLQDDNGGSTQGEITQSAIGLDLVIPLYSGGGTSAKVDQAKARRLQAQKGLELAKRSATQNARASYLNVHSSISQVNALAEVLKSTQTAREAAEAGFEVGTRTAVDVLDAVRQVYRSQRDYIDARHQYVLSALRLKQAAGTLSEEDLQQISQLTKASAN